MKEKAFNMNKKKVKEMIEQTIDFVENKYLLDALATLRLVEVELSKSDWVSVEDGLPEYGENVWVRSIVNPDEIWTTRRTTRWEYEGDVLDSNNFINVGHSSITHWKSIEKLEE